ncbi:hypothetical protein TWF694_011685 [Orbilia ellipsospora]|uniref:Uncharacterized protein n=1 Tax=Orbilia ellipsospora TaxID=2528407 RepID=A0AAV9X5X1_9PEZI
MSTQHYSTSQGTVDADGIRHTTLANGDVVQEAANGPVFLGLRLAGGEAFVESDSEESEEEYHHHHHQQAGAYIPQQHGYPRATSSSPPQYTGQMVMPAPIKKEKKSKKSKKERSGSSSSSSGQQHTCNCGHNHH